jgi:membrane-associated phospholipid phosphatase
MRASTVRIAAAALAIVAFSAFLWLGRAVTRYGEPAGLMHWERGLVNHSTLIAWWLTWSCYPYVLGPIAIALGIVAWRCAAWRNRIAFSVVTMLICWRAADLFQRIFARPRRLDWVVKHETSYSFPSSHAAITVGFYILWAGMLLASELPARTRVTSALVLCAWGAGICWSRLALGAHYLTDLLGGGLLALAVIGAAVAVLPLKVFAPPAGRR